MTEINPCGWLQLAGATHTAAQMRTYLGSLLSGYTASGAITRTRGGVHPGLGGKLLVTANGTPNMSVNVAAGVCYIPGTENVAQGVYFCENDNTVNLTISTAPGAGLNRIDLVVAKVLDQAYSGATNAWSLAVVTGTAAASPSAPALPNNSIALAQIAVGSNVTSIVSGNITDRRDLAAALGGLIPMLSTSQVSTSTVYDGCPGYFTDLDIPVVYNGSVWAPMNAVVSVANYNAQATSQAITSTSYVNITSATLTMTKVFDSTRLLVRVTMGGANTTLSSGVQIFAGINIAGTDYDVAGTYINATSASTHTSFGGERVVTGVLKGSKTCNLRARVVANSYTIDGSERVSMTVEEIV